MFLRSHNRPQAGHQSSGPAPIAQAGVQRCHRHREGHIGRDTRLCSLDPCLGMGPIERSSSVRGPLDRKLTTHARWSLRRSSVGAAPVPGVAQALGSRCRRPMPWHSPRVLKAVPTRIVHALYPTSNPRCGPSMCNSRVTLPRIRERHSENPQENQRFTHVIENE